MAKNPLARRSIHQGHVVKLSIDTIALPNAKVIDLEFVEHPGAAAIVPLDDEGMVTLLRQYRYAAGGWLLEIPAGKLDQGERPEVCAARELQEEAGLIAGKLEPLGAIFATPGFCNERIWLYLARDLTQTQQALEDDEVMELVHMPLSVAAHKAQTGEICDAKTVCALLRAAALVR